MTRMAGVGPRDFYARSTAKNAKLSGKWIELMDDIIGVMRTQTRASFPEITAAVGKRAHSYAQKAYDRFCERPGPEQADTCMEVRREIIKQRKEQQQ